MVNSCPYTSQAVNVTLPPLPGMADQFIFVLGILRLLPARNIEGVAHCFQNGRLAAAPDADQRVQFGREMQRLPVEDATVEVNTADKRPLMLGGSMATREAGSLKANLTASKDSSPNLR